MLSNDTCKHCGYHELVLCEVSGVWYCANCGEEVTEEYIEDNYSDEGDEFTDEFGEIAELDFHEH